MRVEQEHIVHPERSFRLLRMTLEAFDKPRHRHAHLELTWIERGAGLRFVGNHVGPFEAGDMVLVGPHVPHTWISAREHRGEPHAFTVLQLGPALLANGAFPELAALRELPGMAACGLRVTGPAHDAVAAALLRLEAAGSELRRFAALADVLALLAEHAHCLPPIAGAADTSPAADQPERAERERRVERVIAWIHAHFNQPLTVDAAARLVHVTPSAFSRFFRREVGKRFTDYVNDVRCSEACLLLGRSDCSVAAVAQACGFETLSNFNRQFQRRHGASPGAFRRRGRPA